MNFKEKKEIMKKTWIKHIEEKKEKKNFKNEKVEKLFLNSEYVAIGRPYGKNGPLGISVNMYNFDFKRTWYFLKNNKGVLFSYGMDKKFDELELENIKQICLEFYEKNEDIILK